MPVVLVVPLVAAPRAPWPAGEVDWATNTGWGNLATLLKAGVAGAEAGYSILGDGPLAACARTLTTSQLDPGYPASPGGQLSFATDELPILASVPDGLGEFEGTALASIGIFQNPAAVCESYDPFGVPCVIGG